MNSSPEEVEAYIKSLEEPRAAAQRRRTQAAQPAPMVKTKPHSSSGNDSSGAAYLATAIAIAPLFSTPSSADSTPSFDGGGGSFDGGGSSGSF